MGKLKEKIKKNNLIINLFIKKIKLNCYELKVLKEILLVYIINKNASPTINSINC